MNRKTVIILVLALSSVLLFSTWAGFYMTEDNLRSVTHYGTVTIMRGDGVHVTQGMTIDAEDHDPLRVDLSFSVTTRPTLLTCRLVRSGSGAVEVGSLYKGATYWRWTFTLDTVAAGTNDYFISFEGTHDIYSLWYNSFTFKITGDEPTYPAPVFTSRPPDQTVEQGESSTVTWKFVCQAGGYYVIKEGYTELATGAVSATMMEQTVSFDTAVLDSGTHDVMLLVRASDSQQAYDTVKVIVASPSTPTTTPTTTGTTTTTTAPGTTTTTTTAEEPTGGIEIGYFLLAGVVVVVILIVVKRKRLGI